MDNKLSELRKTNNILQNRIRSIVNHGYHSNNDDVHENKFYIDIKYHKENEETSTNIFNLKKGMKSKILSDDVFNRIVCIKGSVKIHFIPFKEEVIVRTPNSQLILPNTRYIIEALEDTELISIYKTARVGERFAINENETIYKKKLVRHE